MIRRIHYLKAIQAVLAETPIGALLGPRQSGKTTLARQLAAGRPSHYFDLETATGRARLERPELTLTPLTGLVVIDEIQRQPELFTALRVLADRPRSRARFLLLGSASPALVRGVSESLAGRVGFVDLMGFDLGEVGEKKWRKLWLRGGFPRSFLAGLGYARRGGTGPVALLGGAALWHRAQDQRCPPDDQITPRCPGDPETSTGLDCLSRPGNLSRS